VVLSLGAITGGAMYLPPIWSLFSKRQTKESLLGTTIISLIINAFFKFFAPDLIGVQLDRASEMTLGVFLPVLLLSIWEIYARIVKLPPSEISLSASEHIGNDNKADLEAESEQEANNNKAGIAKIGLGILAISILLLAVGAYAQEMYSIGMGILLLGLSAWMIKVNKTNK